MIPDAPPNNFILFKMAAEIKAEVGQTLFELVHMEMLSYLIASSENEQRVNRLSIIV
jgi:hypothetical protein